jgi:arylsulfatase A-like enzyme
MTVIGKASILLAVGVCLGAQSPAWAGRPSVVLVVAPRLSAQDVSADGQPHVATPNLNEFAGRGVSLSDFHGALHDAGARAALLTGQSSADVGVTGDDQGRRLLKPGVWTLAAAHKAAGGPTAIFGTWGMGDTTPHRPADFGFGVSVTHGGPFLGSLPDAWGNDGSNDTWAMGESTQAFEGDGIAVAFRTAMAFIEQRKAEPFFCLLAVPHLPSVPAEWASPWEGNKLVTDAQHAAQVVAFDRELGGLMKQLATLGLEKNTLVVVTAATGSAAGAPGLRGTLGSVYDGGHRVPCLWHWPEGGLVGGRRVGGLASLMDVAPTIASLCGLTVPTVRGLDLKASLKDGAAIPERTIVLDRHESPVRVAHRSTVVLRGEWRMVNGAELYDVGRDPAQRHDVAASEAKTKQSMETAYEEWWKATEVAAAEPNAFPIASAAPVTLTALDWESRETPVRAQADATRGVVARGGWRVSASEAVECDVTLRRSSPGVKDPLGDQPFRAVKARLKLGPLDLVSALPKAGNEVTFRAAVPQGTHELQALFIGEKGELCGAYYVTIRQVVEVRAAQPVEPPAAAQPAGP